MNQFVYLDNNATTKIKAEILAEIQPFLTTQFGNPSSSYAFGKKVKNTIENARETVARFVDVDSKQIVFTSGGSEANCSAIFSALMQNPNKNKIVTTKIEHASILEYTKIMSGGRFNCSTTLLDIDSNGNVNLEQLEQNIDANTAIVSIQYANNETGTIVNIEDIFKIVAKKKQQFDFIFHTDAVQALGKIKINLSKFDMASFSGHKVNAPKGVGFLYVKKPNMFIPLIGGHQEAGLRGGTENVIGIVAMGKACELKHDTTKVKKIKDYLEEQIEQIGGITINCKQANRLPNTTSIAFENYEGNRMLLSLERYGICVSTGSACNSQSAEPSHVLSAMKIVKPQNTIRVSINESTTTEQVDYFINKLKTILKGEN